MSVARRFWMTVVMLLCCVILGCYVRFTAYRTEARHPFSGPVWYMPYTNLQDTLLQANFHAHGHAWGGLTFGEHDDSLVVAAYAKQGYQVPTLSNYHKITPRSIFPDTAIYVPAYEHGLNLLKVHCLCIGARDVSYWDYPWHLSHHHTTETLDRLHRHCALVAFAHPGMRNAYDPEDMAGISGMDLMEVGNSMGVRTTFWDSTLSRGNAVWVLANDDSHGLDGREFFIRWNMIYAGAPDTASIYQSLRAGNHYAVYSYDRACEDNRLTEFAIRQDTLWIALRDTFNRLDLYGQGGKFLQHTGQARRAYYPLRAQDTYVRAEVHHDHCVMYLNPVIRYDGKHLVRPAERIPQINYFLTWLVRGMLILVMFAVVRYWWRVMRKKT